MIAPGIYTGAVAHTRTRPRKLSLRHRCFWFALDIDRLQETVERHWLFSRNRPNILSFYDRDHGDGSGGDLRTQIEKLLSEAGLPSSPETIVLFCMPRVAGYGFNPLSVYFCADATGALQNVVYEVHNTFGQRHSYVVPVAGAGQRSVQCAPKAFYVSPFMDMEMSYTFKLDAREDKLLLAIQASDADGPMIFTSVNADRKEFSSTAMLFTWLGHPLLTLKVIAAIHYHAARLWLKGVKLRIRPPPPSRPATLGKTRE
ncbi:MAG: DUF1365 domain-containing protein [Beijerinckiaceae bacterium]